MSWQVLIVLILAFTLRATQQINAKILQQGDTLNLSELHAFHRPYWNCKNKLRHTNLPEHFQLYYLLAHFAWIMS